MNSLLIGILKHREMGNDHPLTRVWYTRDYCLHRCIKCKLELPY